MKGKKIRMPIILLIIFVGGIHVSAQQYEANWKSLDKRPVADWFEDAKLGIFIHWGPYSVPAWSPKGTYSEWYQFWMQSRSLFGNGNFKGDEVWQYHKETYGPHFSYYNFGELFKADLFNADEWAALFEEAGAKYIVLTSKHHDGFTLWPNEQANDRGFAWNSIEVGSKRDLVGELNTAVKKTSVKMGLYYSLYEWYHPWWKKDKARFVDEHMHPQFKDLVQKYEPHLIWSDGEWDMEAEKWKSKELLAWLFNESKVKDDVVINDRWGKGVRFNHGGYYTSEYGGDKVYNKPWEECRGMGFSFGYNQNEDAYDYAKPRTLVLMLVDIVSNGGNLLLDIGPDSRGTIPPIMQLRLKELGAWLKVNGEAIYGTRKWKQPVQWSEGDQKFEKTTHYLGSDYILKQTVNPEPGKAVKELFFTKKRNDIYAIAPKFPKGQLIIKDVKPSKNTKVTLLGRKGNLSYTYKGSKLIVSIPSLTYDELPCQHAWSFKISNVE
ncbi:alpha-L-fucosidase [Tamlana sp. 2201CG12-4]|uniref:alpha-L-fucosidase n=1 Tax=Tamlana sp. 2201CG12-4 TaxID=3112582 RepID=UPI002DBC042C|nr:alpha-L-fucosidase [Tamlana sp. 2201CG12-4]MEC3908637.1 alpha-L-fucosidase [Tamlana sp. 2201CG12-4]